jgi:protein-tyrosine-phosphatase
VKDGLYSILMVCTGNICRSPMAEGLLRTRLSPRAAEFATVSSAGVAAAPGIRASIHSVTVCRENSIDISSHRSRPLTPVLVRQSDLILVMEEHHRDAIVHMAPAVRDKVFVLPQYATESAVTPGIPDPIGQDVSAYREVFQKLDEYITQALPRIEASIAAAGKSV